MFWAVYESFKEYVTVETLEGENKYDAGQYGLQVRMSVTAFCVPLPLCLHYFTTWYTVLGSHVILKSTLLTYNGCSLYVSDLFILPVGMFTKMIGYVPWHTQGCQSSAFRRNSAFYFYFLLFWKWFSAFLKKIAKKNYRSFELPLLGEFKKLR